MRSYQELSTGQLEGRGPAAAADWWREAVVYQVYLRSFADGNGDGVGDLPGLRARLPYLASLGIDALWINPWYPSPMVDGGYDVSDFRDIEPVFGTLEEAEAFIADAHAAGLRIVLDIVPNHTSTEHPWFRAARAGDRAARELFHFRPGRGPDGSEPPNDWQSAFGGPAWTRETREDGTPGEWYLHLYAPEQADLNWTNPAVHEEFLDILRFWFDRGVDGFRVDVAHGLVKANGLPDGGPVESATSPHTRPHPAWDQPGVHDIYREWRALANSYDPPRIFVAEAWVPTNERLARYVQPGGLHSAFQFDLLRSPWRYDTLRDAVEAGLHTSAAVSAPSTWVLSNHDVPRHVTRYARSQPATNVEPDWERLRWPSEPADLDLGRRRARAAVMLVAALPGGMYVYQGEELGLEEIEDIPSALRQDPTWWQMGHTDPGRDGCRVPLPWSGDRKPFGFSPAGAPAPWLPQPDGWASLTVAAQEDDPGSMLHLYRRVLGFRRRALVGAGDLRWLPGPDGVLAFDRGPFQCWVNTTEKPVDLPPGRHLVLCSGPEADETAGVLPAQAAGYIVTSPEDMGGTDLPDSETPAGGAMCEAGA